MPPSRYRVVIECTTAAVGAIVGYAFFILGAFTGNYHTVIWGWFAGFCALRVYSMHVTYLRREFHDKFDAEQLSRIKTITAYLLLGSIVSCAYYLPFAIIYNKTFTIVNAKNTFEINYWPSLLSSFSAIVWLTLLLSNVIMYRNYLLTENLPNFNAEQHNRQTSETSPLLP